MYRVFTMEELAARSMAGLSFTMLMVGIAAVLALILGAVGLYGVLSYGVTQRTQEIGVRMALGAEAGTVRRMVVALASLGLTRYLETLLFGVEPVDAPTFTVVAVLMLAVALIASYLPARRASRVDPVEALRAE